MTCELLQEKKNRKNTPKSLEKKHTPLLIKKKKNPPEAEWMVHQLFQGKKRYTLVFFFSAQFYDLNEWMAHELYQGKKYGTFALPYKENSLYLKNSLKCCCSKLADA